MSNEIHHTKLRQIKKDFNLSHFICYMHHTENKGQNVKKLSITVKAHMGRTTNVKTLTRKNSNP